MKLDKSSDKVSVYQVLVNSCVQAEIMVISKKNARNHKDRPLVEQSGSHVHAAV